LQAQIQVDLAIEMMVEDPSARRPFLPTHLRN
jgi:hypothetical protein